MHEKNESLDAATWDCLEQTPLSSESITHLRRFPEAILRLSFTRLFRFAFCFKCLVDDCLYLIYTLLNSFHRDKSKGYKNWKEETEAVIIQLGSCLTRSGSSGPDPLIIRDP